MKEEGKKLYLDFLQNYNEENLQAAKKSAVFATIFYLLFSFLDAYLAYPNYSQIVYTRVLFTVVLSLIISLVYFESFKIYWQAIYCIFVILAGLGVIIMSTYLNCPIKTLYAQGLLLVIFYGYTMNRLLLIPATIAGITISLFFTIVLLTTPEITPSAIITSLFFQVAANMFGIFNLSYHQRILFKEYSLKVKDTQRARKLISLNKKLKKLASTDGLTNIANRRLFDETLDSEVENSIRCKSPLSLIMLDIDYFKLYNDYYGHIQGDDCLKRIAKLLQDYTQDTLGLAARFGGEEFTILLPNCNQEECADFITRIINGLKSLQIENNDSHLSKYVTASYGAVTACEDFQNLSAKALVTSADSCLYHAKENGRNQFVSSII